MLAAGYLIDLLSFILYHVITDNSMATITTERRPPDGNEYYIVNFPFIDNEYHYDILLSLGDKCECLEPLHVREKMKRRIHDIVAIYKN